MRKGPILLTIGIVLATMSLPMVMAFMLYDDRTVSMYDFADNDSDEDLTIYYYTFEDVSPGKIVVRARDSFLGVGSIDVEIIDLKDGTILEEYELSPGIIFWEEEDTVIKKTGDYEVRITVETYDDEFLEFEAKYSATYSKLGLISALVGFPTFMIAGIAGIVWGAVTIYRQKKGLDKGSKTKFDEKFEGHEPYIDEKKEEWEEYDTSPRRKELWFEPMTNPYDNVPPDYYSRKAAESKAFNKKWHQKWGDEIEGRVDRRLSKHKK